MARYTLRPATDGDYTFMRDLGLVTSPFVHGCVRSGLYVHRWIHDLQVHRGRIEGSTALTNLKGLDNVESVGGYVDIYQNDARRRAPRSVHEQR